MTIRNMQIFTEIYRQGSVTKAAEALHMTQPAVTRAIQDMERHYGVRLFERLHRGLSVTESGKALYVYALHITDTFDQLEKSLLDWDDKGILRIGASITIGNFILPGVVERFQLEKPELRLHVLIQNGAHLQEALLNNEIDLALIEGEVRCKELVSKPFAHDRLVPILPPKHPLAGCVRVPLQRLTAERLLLREKGSAGRSLLDRVFEEKGLPVQPLWESVSTQALVRAVASGLGISILPEQFVQKDIQAGRVATCALDDAAFSRTFYMIWHREKFFTGSMNRLVTLCEEMYCEKQD